MFRIEDKKIFAAKQFVSLYNNEYIITPPKSVEIVVKRIDFLQFEKENLIKDLISGSNKKKIMTKYHITEQNLYRYFDKEFKTKSISVVRKALREKLIK